MKTVNHLILAATASAMLMINTPVEAAQDKILKVEPFSGGFYLQTLWNNSCQIGGNDAQAGWIVSTALAAKSNGWDIWLFNASQLGWGYGSYGGYTCAALVAE